MTHVSKTARLWIGGIAAAGMVALAPVGALAAGGWSIVASPDATGRANSDLSDVSCPTPNDCWAVGYSSTTPFTDSQTLIENWSGSSWAAVPSPNATSNDALFGVTCHSANDCWAVGEATSGLGVQTTLTEHWDGGAWTIVASPNVAASSNLLASVICTSPNDCWTVGYSDNGTTSQTLIEHWQGGKNAAWSIVASPNPVTGQDNVLQDVTCNSPKDCWAVGYSGPHFSNAAVTLIEHWDGAAWTAVSSPNPSPTDLLVSVDCTSPKDCWAAGSQLSGTYQTLTDHWDGAAWTVVSSADTSVAQNNYLYDVACASPHDCWAVGIYLNGTNYQTLTQHWDGTSWTIAPSPNTSSSQSNYLYGLTCQGPACWAVGNSTDTLGNDHTLTEQLAHSH